VLLKLTTDRHEVLHSLSAIAELLLLFSLDGIFCATNETCFSHSKKPRFCQIHGCALRAIGTS